MTCPKCNGFGYVGKGKSFDACPVCIAANNYEPRKNYMSNTNNTTDNAAWTPHLQAKLAAMIADGMSVDDMAIAFNCKRGRILGKINRDKICTNQGKKPHDRKHLLHYKTDWPTRVKDPDEYMFGKGVKYSSIPERLLKGR